MGLIKSIRHEKDPLEYYQNNVQKFVNSEIRVIHFLNTGIQMLETSVASSQFVEQSSESITISPFAEENTSRSGCTLL